VEACHFPLAPAFSQIHGIPKSVDSQMGSLPSVLFLGLLEFAAVTLLSFALDDLAFRVSGLSLEPGSLSNLPGDGSSVRFAAIKLLEI
jgi:hypothetical protein